MDNYAEIFRALADETRLRIMRLLTTTERQVCVCEIVDALDLPQYQISKHLNILKNADLVQCERRGTWAYYYPIKEDSVFNRHLFKLLKGQLSDHVFVSDAEKLKRRLALRDNGTCVIGFAHKSKPSCASKAKQSRT